MLHTLRFFWQQEFRNSSFVGGQLLYSAGAGFLVYLALLPGSTEASGKLWCLFFWLIQGFSALVAAERSFGAEFARQRLYLRSIATSQQIYAAKLVLLLGLLLTSGVITAFTLAMLIGLPIQQTSWFCLFAIIGICALGSATALTGAIASFTRNPGLYGGIIGLPLLFSPITFALRYSRKAADGLFDSLPWADLAASFSLAALFVSIGLLLFPFLNRN